MRWDVGKDLKRGGGQEPAGAKPLRPSAPDKREASEKELGAREGVINKAVDEIAAGAIGAVQPIHLL